MASRASAFVRRARLAAICLPAAAAALPIFADWRDTKALKEEIGTLIAEAEAIGDVCKEENREPTADEAARIDAIMGVGKQGEDGHKPGKVDALVAQLQRMQKIENRRSEITNLIGGPNAGGSTPGPQADTEQDKTQGSIVARVTVPAAVYRPAKLKAFRGDRVHAERGAFAFGRFALATLCGHSQSDQWCKEHGLDIRAGQSGSDLAKGGYLVPSELSRAILDVREEYGVARGEVKIETMVADTKDVAKRLTGLPYFWVSEGDQITTGDKTWGNVALAVKKLGVIAKMSSEISEDAIISLGDDLAQEIGEAFALAEDHAVFIADGTATYGTYTGLLEAVGAAGIAEAEAGKTSLDDLVLKDFTNAIKKIPGRFRRGCKWYCNSTVYDATIGPILDVSGGNRTEDLESGSSRRMFKGYPVVETQVLPEAESVGADGEYMIFGNLRAGVILGDRRRVTIARSEHAYFDTDEIGIRGTERIDVNIHEAGDGDDVGAYVVLKLPSA